MTTICAAPLYLIFMYNRREEKREKKTGSHCEIAALAWDPDAKGHYFFYADFALARGARSRDVAAVPQQRLVAHSRNKILVRIARQSERETDPEGRSGREGRRSVSRSRA